MKKVLEINDLKILAKKKLPKMFYDYVDSGSYTESTYLENETDFNKIKLRQRVGRDISTSRLSKKFLEKGIQITVWFCSMWYGRNALPRW